MIYELALFAGAGGGILGGKLLGWQTVAAVEVEKYPCGVLMQRQNDLTINPFPVWSDVRSFTKRNNQCRNFIKSLCRIRHQLIISGGFPCQDISVAGKGEGLDGENSGLWREYFRLVREIRPSGVYVENSPALTSRGINRVLGDLASVGYDAQWGVLSATNLGANHLRKRIWIVAYPSKAQWGAEGSSGFVGSRKDEMANTGGIGWDARRDYDGKHDWSKLNPNGLLSRTGEEGKRRQSWWDTEPELGRVAHGVACRVDRLAAIGNGQVPAVAAGAWAILTSIMTR